MIDWEDHTGDAGWTTEEEASKEQPVIARTVGYKVHENRKSIKLADSLTSDGGIGGVSLILKSAIVNKWTLSIDKG
jgi:hypothetical protein